MHRLSKVDLSIVDASFACTLLIRCSRSLEYDIRDVYDKPTSLEKIVGNLYLEIHIHLRE